MELTFMTLGLGSKYSICSIKRCYNNIMGRGLHSHQMSVERKYIINYIINSCNGFGDLHA